MIPETTGQQDLRTYLRILWRWKLLFLCFVIAFPVGAYFLERGKAKLYQSSTLVQPLSDATPTGSGVPLVPISLTGVAALVTTTGVAQGAAASLHPPGNAASLVGEVSAVPNQDTGFLTITAQDRNPVRAAAIANAFAAALNSYQQGQAARGIDSQLAADTKQLAATPRSDTASRAVLSNEIATLRASRSSTGTAAEVIEPATPSATPLGSSTRREVEIGLVIGLLLGLGAVLVAENSDRRIRTPEDLEALTGMPLLGTLAPSAFSPSGRDSERDAESFQMLSAALTLFNLERRLASVAIISPGPGDGKTTVAVGLAVATARAGARVILVDADLRRSQVCARLGIGQGDGLGAVLTRERSLADVLVECQLPGAEVGALLVLPAGPPRPNPMSLLTSQEMRTILRQLEARADLVIVDTPAALAVGDALPLLPAVSGVLIAVRLNQSSRAAVRRLQKLLAAADGTVVGVVATACATGTGEYGYYGARGRNGRPRRWLRSRRRPAAALVPKPASPGELELATAALHPSRAPQSAAWPNGAAQPRPGSAAPSRQDNTA